MGYVLSVLWRPHEKHSFGILYRSKVSYSLEGRSKSNPAALLPLEDTDAALDLPDYIDVGYSYRSTPQWNIKFDVEWINWDRFNTVTLERESGDLPPIPFHWKSSFIYQLGVSYYYKNYVFSCGYDYNENSLPDSNFTPVVADADRHWLNFGVGQRDESFSWDVAYQFGYSDRTVEGSGLSDGSYEVRAHVVVISCGYHF